MVKCKHCRIVAAIQIQRERQRETEREREREYITSSLFINQTGGIRINYYYIVIRNTLIQSRMDIVSVCLPNSQLY